MERRDFNLIASVLRTSLASGDTRPAVVRDFIEAFVRTYGQDFQVQPFLDGCLGASGRRQRTEAEIRKGLRLDPAPPPARPFRRTPTVDQMNRAEQDGALFKCILDVEFPDLQPVRCAYSQAESGRFAISRMGLAVVIRFGPQALCDPVEAVRAAAPDAQVMLLGQTHATSIQGRT